MSVVDRQPLESLIGSSLGEIENDPQSKQMIENAAKEVESVLNNFSKAQNRENYEERRERVIESEGKTNTTYFNMADLLLLASIVFITFVLIQSSSVVNYCINPVLSHIFKDVYSAPPIAKIILVSLIYTIVVMFILAVMRMGA